MQLITLEKSQTTKLFWLIVGLLMVVAVVTADQSDPGVTAAGGLLALVAVWPLYLWLLGSSHGLPIWPVFSLVTGVTYALPMIQNSESLSEYTSTDVIVGGITTMGFIGLGTIIWLSLTSRMPKAPRSVLMIEQVHSVRYLLIFIGLGVLFGVNQVTGWINLPGNLMPVVRGIAMSLNTMGLFVLAYYHGRGLLNKRDFLLFAAGAVATMMMNMTSLMLAQAIVPVALVIFGYMLGSNQLPWRLLLVAFLVTGLLHPGKYEMRTLYWGGEEGSKALSLTTLPEFYWDWFSYGMEEVGGVTGIVTGPKEEGAPTSIFERSGNLHMLLLVQKKTPSEVPYFDGATYAPIPRLLIPRFLDDQKGISHAGNVMLTVNYGLQTLEQTASTSIGWGLLPEAYANFGYLGITGLAIMLAIFYAFITNLTVGVPMTSLRFVLGLLIMAAATRADTMGVFVTTQFQGVVGVSLAALVLMKRRPNPFAMGWEHTIPQLEGRVDGEGVGRRGRRTVSTQQTAHDKRHEAGEGHEAEGIRHEVDGGAKQLAADGGVVRTMPVRAPQRIARWMPRRVRQQVAAEQRAAAEGGDLKLETGVGEEEEGRLKDEEAKRQPSLRDGLPSNQLIRDGRERPRQLAVPYQNYRRYRSG